MGCLGCEPRVDPEIAKILATLDIKVEEYNKVFEKEAKKAKDAFDKQQENRKTTLEQWKKESKEITEQDIRNLNKAEFEVEVDFLVNQLDKMHYIFSIALELVEPIKKITLEQLMEKAKSAPAITLNEINRQIEEIKNYPTIDFYNSTYGKVIRDALEKKGLSATVIKRYKNNLFKERKARRKAEKEEFGIEKNEFDDETLDDLKLDLYQLITEKYDENLDKNFREYSREKMIEAWISK